MGIRLLNTFLNAQNVNGIKKNEHFSMLKRKTICVDISIYLYKFKQEAANTINENTGELLVDPHEVLLTRIEYMVNVLRRYQCELVVVFDGKPPKEKEETLEERRVNKKAAQSKNAVYKQMLIQRANQLSKEDKASLCNKIIAETKKSISINKQDIEAVKELFDELRVKYIECEGEADDVCVELVKKGEAWAVMSDDTDFIAQCCKRVLRNVDFDNQRYDFINTQIVLYSLHMNQYDFKCICVLGGCDYYKLETKNNKQINIFKLYEYFCKYSAQIENNKNNKRNRNNQNDQKEKDFLSWLAKYLEINVEEVNHIIDTHMN